MSLEAPLPRTKVGRIEDAQRHFAAFERTATHFWPWFNLSGEVNRQIEGARVAGWSKAVAKETDKVALVSACQDSFISRQFLLPPRLPCTGLLFFR